MKSRFIFFGVSEIPSNLLSALKLDKGKVK